MEHVTLANYTPNANKTMYLALRCDHNSGGYLSQNMEVLGPSGSPMDETSAGQAVRRLCLDRPNKKHFGPLEHVHLVYFAFGYPRYAITQLRTHRHLSMDAQSFRFADDAILDAAETINNRIADVGLAASRALEGYDQYQRRLYKVTGDEVSRVFYLPTPELFKGHAPPADTVSANTSYVDQLLRYRDLRQYARTEDARSVLGVGIRQNALISMNLRALLHIASVRLGKNTQGPTREMVSRMVEAARPVSPEIIDWFQEQKPEKLSYTA